MSINVSLYYVDQDQEQLICSCEVNLTLLSCNVTPEQTREREHPQESKDEEEGGQGLFW